MHTARHIASAPIPRGGGVPHPWPEEVPGYSPHHDLAGGTPSWNTPPPPGRDLEPVKVLWDRDGVPPERTWDQWKYYRDGDGVPPGSGQTDICENSNLPHPLDAGGKNTIHRTGLSEESSCS